MPTKQHTREIAGLPAAFDAKTIPAVIFTNPEIAWTGLTETEAQERGIEYKKAEFPWGASGKAIATDAFATIGICSIAGHLPLFPLPQKPGDRALYTPRAVDQVGALWCNCFLRPCIPIRVFRDI